MRRGRQRAGKLDDEDPGAVGRDRSAPERGTVRHEPDRAEQGGGVGSGGHGARWYRCVGSRYRASEMTARSTPATRGLRRSLGLAAPIAAAVVLWLALAPLLAAPSLPRTLGGGAVGGTRGPRRRRQRIVVGRRRVGESGRAERRTRVARRVARGDTVRNHLARNRQRAPEAGSLPGRAASRVGRHAGTVALRDRRTLDRPPAAIRRVDRPSATPLMKASLDRQLDKLRAKLGIPGVSAAILFADGSMLDRHLRSCRRRGPARRSPLTRRSPSEASRRRSPRRWWWPSPARAGSASTRRCDATCRSSRSIAGSRSASCSTTRAASTTSSSNAKIDAALLADPGRGGGRPTARRTWGSRTSRRGAGYHYSNTNYLILGMLAEARRRRPARRAAPRPIPRPARAQRARRTRAPSRRPRPAPTATGSPARRSKLPAIDLTGASIVPFTSVVTAAGGAGSIATTAIDSSTGPGPCTAATPSAEPTVRAMLGDVAGRPPTARRRRTASASSPSPSTGDRRSAIRAGCSGSGPSCDGFRRVDDDRRADQPEPSRPADRSSGPAARAPRVVQPRRLRRPARAAGSPRRGARCGSRRPARRDVRRYQRPGDRYRRVFRATRRARHTLRSRSRGNEMPIRVDAYIADGTTSGLLARTGQLREALEDAGGLVARARSPGSRSTVRRAAPAGSATLDRRRRRPPRRRRGRARPRRSTPRGITSSL